ncbi:hypothetical protein pdam_00023865 [Pocillopora damicornis]|uniref:Uncharacterized protein n=1 Tax=Pocillopora damicornis TaxID=46731 RepID=A0A3M6T4V0_POCDA|nr:hypothetical protein pdam_00023865 [Pocillopora damicornis]
MLHPNKWKDRMKSKMKGLTNLLGKTIHWSQEPFIRNAGIQNLLVENHREELTYYLHFSNSKREPPCGNAYYDQIGKMCLPFSPFWITFKMHKNSPKNCPWLKL